MKPTSLQNINGVIRLTWPIARRVFRTNKKQLLYLLLVTIVLGVLPTLKSRFESGIIDVISNYLRGGQSETPMEILLKPVTSDHPVEGDLLEQIAGAIFRATTMAGDVMIYLGIIGLTFVIGYISTRTKTGINLQLFTSLREEGFRKMLNKNPGDMPSLSNSSGQYASAVHVGTNNISSLYSYLMDAIQSIVAFVTAIILLVTNSGWLVLAFLVLLVLHVWVSRVRSKRLKRERNELEKSRNHLSAYTDEIFSKKEIILANDQGERYVGKLNDHARSYGEIDRSLEIKESVFSGINNMLRDVQDILLPLLIFLFVAALSMKNVNSIGDVYFVISLYSRLTSPLLSLLSQYDSIKRTEATSATFLKILVDKPERKPGSDVAKEAPASGNAVIFKDVTFAYPVEKKEEEEGDGAKEGEQVGTKKAATRPVLANCSFRVPDGKITIILGPSGSGKSTIAKLILRFWDHSKGAILFRDKPIDHLNIVEHRLQLGYVAQGVHIVEENLRNNLNWSATGQPVPDEKIKEALRMVGLNEFATLHDLENKEAKDLSGGQAQRLSIARAILDDSPVLILDEPMSGVDVFTINELLPVLKKNLLAANDKRTVIIITHKLTFTKLADHIIILDKNGTVREEGSPQMLMENQDSHFRKAIDLSCKELCL